MEKDLEQLVERLKLAAGPNLISVVLYGSATSGDFHRKHSDLNVLCVLKQFDAAELDQLNATGRWWVGKGHPAPILFALDELRRFADVFAIELLDIQASRRVLFGEDVFAALGVPMHLHKQQLERELETNLIRLRQAYLSAPRDAATLTRLMSGSVSTFTALFRHVLIAFGENPPSTKRAVVDRLAALLGFDAAGFHCILDTREGKRQPSKEELLRTFAAYLAAVRRVVEEVDRRLSKGE